MSLKIATTTLAAFACAAIVSAQAPQTPQNPDRSQAPVQRAPETKSAPAGGTVSVTGCIERAPSPTPGSSVGTTGATGVGANDARFMLTRVMKPAGSAASSSTAAAPATSYRLDADDSKLTGHVGHKVEITGTLIDRSSSTTPNSSATPNAANPAPNTGATPNNADPAPNAANPNAASAAPNPSRSNDAPRLKVESVKMIAASCTE